MPIYKKVLSFPRNHIATQCQLNNILFFAKLYPSVNNILKTRSTLRDYIEITKSRKAATNENNEKETETLYFDIPKSLIGVFAQTKEISSAINDGRITDEEIHAMTNEIIIYIIINSKTP